MRSPSGLKGTDRILQRARKSCQTFLDLRGQTITAIPQEVFIRPFPQNLRVLDLSCNGLQSLASEICLLTSLEELYLGHNNIKNLPNELGELSHLGRLDLVHNQLQELPFCFSKLKELEWLNLSGNLIEIVPPWLFCLPKLVKLYLIQNLIENIPRSVYLCGLERLRDFFRIHASKEGQSLDKGVRHVLLSPAITSSAKYKGDKGKVEVCLKKPVKGQNQLMVNPIEGRCSQAARKTIKSQSALPCVEYYPDSYSKIHHNTVKNLMELQHSEVQLLREQEEKMCLRQECRKQNINHLQRVKRQQQPVDLLIPKRKLDLTFLGSPSEKKNRRRMTTSDYGTCSSFVGSTEVVDHLYTKRKDSLGSSLSALEDAVNNNSYRLQRLANYISDSNSMCLSDLPSNDPCVDECDVDSLPDRRKHITHGDICVVIPEDNISGIMQSEFFLEVVEDTARCPKLNQRQVVASEVIEMEPHGAKFYPDDPAIISLPYDVRIGRNDNVVCMCSNTAIEQKTAWEVVSSEDYQVFSSYVEIKAYHFSLFAVVVTKGYPEARKTIRAGIGGCLFVPEVPGVEVLFPETSLLHDIEASVQVLYAGEPHDVNHSDPCAFAPATPVVRLGPHGCHFNPNTSEIVTVRLPLPNGKEILERFGNRQLTFWCSSTTEHEDHQWQQFQPKFAHIDNDPESICSVYFSVDHFSFFTALWDIIDAVLWEAKLSASSLIPIFQFYISCQALMSESEDGARFGLCIVCYRFGKPLEGIGNFPILVGKDPAPKMISTGKLLIRLMSDKFKADISVGETELVACEDFTGRPFVKQFACQFTCEVPSDGNFGKVVVEQPLRFGGSQCIFSFLLNKPRDPNSFDGSLDWEVQLTKELTGLLSIKAEKDMGDEVWQEMAESLGYTQREINKFRSSTNPLADVIADYKRRGGMPHKFISAIYKTGSQDAPSTQHRSQVNGWALMEEEKSEMEARMCPCVKKNARKRKFQEEVNWEELFQDLAGKIPDNWKKLGRVLGVSESKIKEIEHDCSMKQDGVQEMAIQMFLSWRDLQPDRCTLNNLSHALCKIGLGYVARQHCLGVGTHTIH